MTRITLASQSRVRGDLLRAAGVAIETASPGVDEDAVKERLSGSSPRHIAGVLADEKALAVSGARDGLVIGADQTLEFEGRLYDKARDVAEARTRLMQFRGKPHQLHAAVSLARGDTVIWRETVTATLTMRDFTDAWLGDYLAGNDEDILSSVGCYQLENIGVQLFSAIEGDYFAILGLPMLGLLEALRREGALDR
jgi:septum formation protein